MDWDEDEVTVVIPVVVQDTEERPLSAYFIVLAGAGVGVFFLGAASVGVVAGSQLSQVLIEPQQSHEQVQHELQPQVPQPQQLLHEL